MIRDTEEERYAYADIQKQPVVCYGVARLKEDLCRLRQSGVGVRVMSSRRSVRRLKRTEHPARASRISNVIHSQSCQECVSYRDYTNRIRARVYCEYLHVDGKGLVVVSYTSSSGFMKLYVMI